MNSTNPFWKPSTRSFPASIRFRSPGDGWAWYWYTFAGLRSMYKNCAASTIGVPLWETAVTLGPEGGSGRGVTAANGSLISTSRSSLIS